MTTSSKDHRLKLLINEGIIAREALDMAARSAEARGIDTERVLIDEYSVPRDDILRALSDRYGCEPIQYDERLPVPTELFRDLNSDLLSLHLWFPLIKDGNRIIIAANNPESETVRRACAERFPGADMEFRVALPSDIQWYIQDYLHARPENIIGIERTGLAFWRNTMAHWRTRLACYRTDLAKGRTALSILRWGLGLVALSDVLFRTRSDESHFTQAYWLMMMAGAVFSLYGFVKYMRARQSKMSAPRHDTLVHVTASTTSFLERYHLDEAPPKQTKGTMLARLGDFLPAYCTILKPVPASKERTHLARERNVLAAGRTIAACYRTMYSSARTGLACIRTGVAFFSFGLAFFHYYRVGLQSFVELFLAAAGMLMVIDGVLWYLPARKERDETVRAEA